MPEPSSCGEWLRRLRTVQIMAPKLVRRFLLELTRRGDELTHEISLNTVIRYWRRYPILPFESFGKCVRNFQISEAPANYTAVSIMPAMTALRFDAVLSVKIIHRIEPGAETTKRHNDVYEVGKISLDSLCVLSAFVAGHVYFFVFWSFVSSRCMPK